MKHTKRDASPKSPAESLIGKLEELKPFCKSALAEVVLCDAIAIVRKHQAEQPQDVMERVAKAIAEVSDSDNPWQSYRDFAKAAIIAMGDGRATIAPVSAETLQPIAAAISIATFNELNAASNITDERGITDEELDRAVKFLASIKPRESANSGHLDDTNVANIPSEITEVDERALTYAMEALMDAHDKYPYERFRWVRPAIKAYIKHIQPVPVSVEVCIAALWNAYHNQMHGLGDYWANKQGRPEVFKEALAYGEYEKDAKTVLDAAGVKYA